jgi:hypothetical protein
MPMRYEAATVQEYIDALPENRKSAIRKLRGAIRKNLPQGFAEVIGYGMPAYVVPHSLYPDGYHCDPKLPLPFLSIASQKNFVAVYHMGVYADPVLLKWFTGEYAKLGMGKLDLGKSCIRFKKPVSIPCDLSGKLAGNVTR